MKGILPSWIFRIALGGGDRHKLGICAMAIAAANNGYKVENMDSYRPGQIGQVPDLIISRQEKMINGPRRHEKTFRYRVEIIDTNDPVPDPEASLLRGFDDVVKVFLQSGDAYCANGHIVKGPVTSYPYGHPLCIDGLFFVCLRSLP